MPLHWQYRKAHPPSPSMRREWIEILKKYISNQADESPSMRREWIEITMREFAESMKLVSLHAEGVD